MVPLTADRWDDLVALFGERGAYAGCWCMFWPVGWVAVAPREEFGRMQQSPTAKPLDDTPAWAVNCFYVDRHHRGSGVGRALLDAPQS